MSAVLYIIIRSDLDSLNTGKIAAQAAHASNAFVHHYHSTMQESAIKPKELTTEQLNSSFSEWETQTTQGFGTVLVLEAPINPIKDTVALFKENNYLAGIVHDPTYPIVDGYVVHKIPLDTCAYIFILDREKDVFANTNLSNFNLHR